MHMWSWGLKRKRFKAEPPLVTAQSHLVFRPSAMAPKVAATVDESRSDHALAHQVMFYLKKSMREEQNSVGSWKVDLGPHVTRDVVDMGRSFKHPTPADLDGLPFDHQLPAQPQASDGFRWLEHVVWRNVQSFTRRWVSARGKPLQTCGAVIIEELNAFPCWIEARKDLLAPGLQRVLERFLNAILETHYEMFHVVPDAVFSTIANRVAEACLRCQFRPAANNPVIASATPPGTSPRNRRSLSTAQALGFGPAHDPNLDPNLRAPPITDPPSTHLAGTTTMGISTGAATGETADGNDEDAESWEMGHWFSWLALVMLAAAIGHAWRRVCSLASAGLCGGHELCLVWS